jgi:hypothetical protein
MSYNRQSFVKSSFPFTPGDSQKDCVTIKDKVHRDNFNETLLSFAEVFGHFIFKKEKNKKGI